MNSLSFINKVRGFLEKYDGKMAKIARDSAIKVRTLKYWK